jgi:tungstate transport system permease protein
LDDSILIDGLRRAFVLIFTGDARVYEAAFVSVWVSCAATAIASGLGLPLGFLVAVRRFRGRDLVVTLLNTLLALPTVVVGLFVYSLIRRGSPLGPLDLLFSPGAMIAGQVVLALPIVAALGQTAVSSLDPAARETALALGASPGRVMLTTAWEARYGLFAAVAAAGGRLIGEVGVSMMLGGNIAHHTRNLTTAIALETSKGEFALAMALGVVLLALALGLNFLLRRLQGRREEAY